jgi:hypothetical protein
MVGGIDEIGEFKTTKVDISNNLFRFLDNRFFAFVHTETLCAVRYK